MSFLTTCLPGVSISICNSNPTSNPRRAPFRGKLYNGLWGAPAQVDPVETLFSHLQHCTKLTVDLLEGDCLRKLIPHARRLEELSINYMHQFPSMDALRGLLVESANLRKCTIEVNIFNEASKNGSSDFLKAFQTLGNCNFNIAISGTDKKKVEELSSHIKPKMTGIQGRTEVDLQIRVY